ncbi:MAG TPA: DUF6448 family protein [Bryobacteraceae bacterium]|nr:DUF6448 family protein [Bryobacteraceae bacterium]
MNFRNVSKMLTIPAALAFVLSAPPRARAHCDGMDGPVVKAARHALESNDVNPVLIWVQPQDEAEIRKIFAQTIAVRSLSPEGRELADRYFFETLVRIHRAGEGASYTGLKPAGQDAGPAISAADRAIETGSPDALVKLLTQSVHEGVAQRFQEVIDRKRFAKDDVGAGREYVKVYVEFVHYVERIHEAAVRPAHGTHAVSHTDER